jgi:hypothetical protein
MTARALGWLAQGGSIIFLGDNYFYQHYGWSSGGRTTTAGEFFIVETESDISGGISDSNTDGTVANPKSAVKVTGSYASLPGGTGSLTLVDAEGTSAFNLYVVDFNINILDPNASPSGFFSGGGNALMLHTDTNVNGTGVMIRNPNSGFSPFLGSNALQLTNAITTSTTRNELDLVGVATADVSHTYRVSPIMIRAILPVRLRFLVRQLQVLSLRIPLTKDAPREVSQYRHRPPLELIRLFHRRLRALAWLTTGSIAHSRLFCRPIPRRAVRVFSFSSYYPKGSYPSMTLTRPYLRRVVINAWLGSWALGIRRGMETRIQPTTRPQE